SCTRSRREPGGRRAVGEGREETRQGQIGTTETRRDQGREQGRQQDSSLMRVTIVGGGLAGSEAAWQVASRGVPVTLHEMRPVQPTAVHRTDALAELVCSNSFRGDKLDNAVGLLKEEMRRLGCVVMR